MLDHARHNRPMRCMKLLPKDEIAGIAVLSGDSNILVLTSIGTASLYNEGDINPVSPKAGGIKAISQLKCNTVEALLAFDPNERGKIVLITDKGCQRVFNIDKLTKTNRLGKVQTIFQSFKSDVHHLVAAVKIPYRVDSITISLALSDQSIYTLEVNDFNVTDTLNAKKNIDIPSKTKVEMLVNETIEIIDHNTRAYGTIINTEDEKESSEEFDNSSEELLNEPSEETSEENEPIDEVETKIEEVKETIEEENETLEESESLIPEEVLKEEEVEEVKEEKTPKKSDKNKKKVEQISIFELFDDDDE